MATIKDYVHTLGDSTLDNLYWLLNGRGDNLLKTAKDNSVEGQLQTKLGHEFEVVSHAYDGFTTSSVLGRDMVGAVLPGKRSPEFAAYLQEKGRGIVSPLEKLERVVSDKPHATHHVVISVGGNDFRVHLQRNPLKLLTDVPNIQKRYLEILDRVQALKGNIRPTLMFQYRPDATNDNHYYVYKTLGILGGLIAAVNVACVGIIARFGFALVTRKVTTLSGTAFIGGALAIVAGLSRVVPWRVTLGILKGQRPGMVMIGALMEKFYRPMLERAKKDKLPILDLPNSFNPYEPLYISGIEPNEQGGKLIAEGLSHIVRWHEYTSFKIYESKGIRIASYGVNPDQWQVEYISKPAKPTVSV